MVLGDAMIGRFGSCPYWTNYRNGESEWISRFNFELKKRFIAKLGTKNTLKLYCSWTLLVPYFEEAKDTIDKVIESKKSLVGSTTWEEFKVNNYESQ